MRRIPARKSIAKDDTGHADTVTVSLSKGKMKMANDESVSAINSAATKSKNIAKITKQGRDKNDCTSKVCW